MKKAESKTTFKMSVPDKVCFLITMTILIGGLVALVFFGFTKQGKEVLNELDYQPVEYAMEMKAEYESYADEYARTGSIDAMKKANEIAYAYSRHIKSYGTAWGNVDLPEDFVYYLETIK